MLSTRWNLSTHSNKNRKKLYQIKTPETKAKFKISNNANKFKDSERFMIDIKRIKELGFQNKVSLQAGVNEIFEYFDS